MSMSPQEIVQMTQQVYSLLKLMTDDGALAGVILTNQSYDHVKRLFGDAKIPYKVGDITLDPGMNDCFVVDNLLILRGTQLQ